MGLLDKLDGINTGTIKDPFGISGVGNIGLSFGENGPSLSANFNKLLKKKTIGSNVGNGPLSKLFADATKFSALQFPLDLDSEHYMIIHVVARNKFGPNSKEEKETLGSIVLPLPSNLKAEYGAKYANENMGVAGALMAGTLTNDEFKAGMSDLASTVGNAGLDMVTNEFNRLTGKEALSPEEFAAQQDAAGKVTAIGGLLTAAGIGKTIGGGTGAVIGAIAGGVDTAFKGAMSSAGKAFNPHMAVLFEGVDFRSYTFDYEFIAKNKAESDQLREIIYMLKRFMHPSLANKLVFKYPEEFEIEFSDAVKPYLWQPQRAVMTSFNVDYNGQGQPVWFEDSNAPVSIKISMGFQETKITTKETIEAEHKNSGSLFSEG
jgi:hypothetical protein